MGQHLRRARRGAQGGPQPAVCVVQARVGWPERVAERGTQRGLRLCETRLVAQEGALLGAGGWWLGTGAGGKAGWGLGLGSGPGCTHMHVHMHMHLPQTTHTTNTHMPCTCLQARSLREGWQ